MNQNDSELMSSVNLHDGIKVEFEVAGLKNEIKSLNSLLAESAQALYSLSEKVAELTLFTSSHRYSVYLTK